MLGVDEIDRPCEPAGKHVLGECMANRARIVARPDHRDRARTQDKFEIADGHGRILPAPGAGRTYSNGCTIITLNVRSTSSCSLIETYSPGTKR